jgi:SAM-dependent methyltransferase
MRALGASVSFELILRRILRQKIPNEFVEQFRRKSGIEIGGPSSLFKKRMPIYPIIGSLDNVNFCGKTSWGHEQFEGRSYHYQKSELGNQYICDAVDLGVIDSGRYEFVLSCHNLEHIANPLKAMKEWLRLLKPFGLMLLVLPNKNFNFDHKRQITLFDHLLDDYRNNIAEDDLTHLQEILAMHDLARDPGAGDRKAFEKRSSQNYQFRCLHHHVFDMSLIKQVYGYLQIDLVLDHSSRTELIALGKRAA